MTGPCGSERTSHQPVHMARRSCAALLPRSRRVFQLQSIMVDVIFWPEASSYYRGFS